MGNLKMSNKGLDQYNDYYCVLDIQNQKMKLYSLREKDVVKIYLKGFKVEESRENEFMLSKADRNYNFKTYSQEDYRNWVEVLQRSILILTPEIIYFKIEPMGSTKLLTFYSINSNQGDLAKIVEVSNLEEDQKILKKLDVEVNITNNISISIIDNVPREIMNLSLSKLQFKYTRTEEKDYDEEK
jgi:hypothetical protein